MSVYIFGLAVGQLAYGPLSDRFGRRPVLMAGLVLYAMAGLAAAFVARRPQPDRRPAAAGAGRLRRPGDRPRHRARHRPAAGGRAPARDDEPDGRRRTRRRAADRRRAGLERWAGARSSSSWRCSASSTCCSRWRLLPESKAPASAAKACGLARNYGQLLVSPAFLGYAMGGGCATTSMYAFIGASPFIFAHQLHRPDYEVGIYPAIVLAGRLDRQRARPRG